MKMSNKTYDILKYVLLVVEPAIVTLISGLGIEYGLDTGRIVATIGLVSTFLGSVTNISSNIYKKSKGDE